MPLAAVDELNTLKSSIKKCNNIAEYHRLKIGEAIQFALSCNGHEPSPEQKISDSFYEQTIDAELATGDLLDVKKLNEALSAHHNSLDLYEGTYAKRFYPYFFERYQYACIATQDCKITHNKVRAIEICALKPLTAVVCELLPKEKISKRSKVLPINRQTVKDLGDRLRKLSDQQHDDLFFYHDYYEGESLRRAAAVACIDIKIPIRVMANFSSGNIEAIKSARIASIKPIFRSKLCEKIARHYISVALQDSKSHFLNEDGHSDWISRKLKENFFLIEDKDKDTIPLIEQFIAHNESFKSFTIEEIWNNSKHIEEIHKLKEQLITEASQKSKTGKATRK